MAKRRERDLGSNLAKFVEDKIEDVIDQRQSEEEVLDQVGREDPVLKKILSTFPSSEGYYGKLYKMLPSGKMEMKHHFMALEELNDPEIEVAELSKERNWGSGDYKLRVFKQGEAGCQKSLTMRIDVPTVDSSGKETSSLPPQQSLTEKLTELSGIISTVKDILPKNEPTDTRMLSQVLSDTFKSGVQVVKEAMSDSKGGNGKSSVVEIITALKDLGVIGKEEKKTNEVELVEKVLKNLKDMGALKTTEPKDTLSELIELRKSGLIKMAGEEKDDTLSSVEKIKSLIEVIGPLLNPSGEKATFWNTLAPHIPKFIENLASPFRDYIELRKIELQQRMGKPLPPPQIRRPLVAPVPQSTQAEGSPQEDIPIQEQVSNVHPIVAEITAAVASNDQSYFPKLQELIILFIGPHVIPALVSGTVSVDTFLSLVSSSAYGDIFNLPESKVYLEAFIEWSKNQSPSQEAVVAGNGSIPVKCEKCGEEFDVLLEEWKMDDKVCDCGGNLKEMIQVPT